MADFDLFNGDADGIFSLLQLRQVDPRPEATHITGVKRDIKLFPQLTGRVTTGDRVTALDISLAKNQPALSHVLEVGASVFYCDHHQAGDVPDHPNLTTILSDAPEICTAILIDRHLSGAKTSWAICGAYGDNFPNLAHRVAQARGLTLPMGQLRELGELVNYNAYGLNVEDLHCHPSDLYALMRPYPGPVEFLSDDPEIMAKLRDGYRSDWDIAQNARTLSETDQSHSLILPSGAASNRISGLFGNALVDEEPEKAFAILTELEDGASYRVSIRAPRTRTAGSAADLAAQFGGGGRAAAAGIDALKADDLTRFMTAFERAFTAA